MGILHLTRWRVHRHGNAGHLWNHGNSSGCPPTPPEWFRVIRRVCSASDLRSLQIDLLHIQKEFKLLLIIRLYYAAREREGGEGGELTHVGR